MTTDSSNDDDPCDLTVQDVYETSGPEVRARLDAALGALYDDIEEDVDEELLDLIRKGGHSVVVNDHHRRQEVQIDSYRSGPTYGQWALRCSPEGHQVVITHFLPREYDHTGFFLVSVPVDEWTVPVDGWRSDPVRVLAQLTGKRIAADAAPLLRVPENIAPDALVGDGR